MYVIRENRSTLGRNLKDIGPKSRAKAILTAETEKVYLGETFIDIVLPNVGDQAAVEGRQNFGHYRRDRFGNTTDEFDVRRTKVWYGVVTRTKNGYKLT